MYSPTATTPPEEPVSAVVEANHKTTELTPKPTKMMDPKTHSGKWSYNGSYWFLASSKDQTTEICSSKPADQTLVGPIDLDAITCSSTSSEDGSESQRGSSMRSFFEKLGKRATSTTDGSAKQNGNCNEEVNAITTEMSLAKDLPEHNSNNANINNGTNKEEQQVIVAGTDVGVDVSAITADIVPISQPDGNLCTLDPCGGTEFLMEATTAKSNNHCPTVLERLQQTTQNASSCIREENNWSLPSSSRKLMDDCMDQVSTQFAMVTAEAKVAMQVFQALAASLVEEQQQQNQQRLLPTCDLTAMKEQSIEILTPALWGELMADDPQQDETGEVKVEEEEPGNIRIISVGELLGMLEV